ncbi:prepilin-type N-terminal cleavage/methylation domain-containing protein [Rhizobium laguerreae]|uniref:prepilin-type N-terminal cleavage/methylation domain-containing protein n=1 Tax=Rhizobium laguerreae TaxID=1076926 RepID=UPI001C90BA85|nr:prepilin-type N-terminal cleavage/methylation domain-containing protein [Rhizobium laguerreae]MBY3136114.1 prepilin-type N-terminal cleavage/methylation domain-containing protein [Rhizobium laguerreae]
MRSMHQASRQSEDGFTLVEMLVTLALLAALSTVFLGAVAQFRPLRTLAQSADGQLELTAAASFLQATIADARSVYLIDAGSQKRLVFEGSEHSLHFPAVLRVGSDQIAFRDISIDRVETGGSVSVVLRNTPRRLTSTMPAHEVFPVIEDIIDVNFQFLEGTNLTGSEPQIWLARWDHPERLPYAVKVTVKAKRGLRTLTASRIALLQSNR